MDLDKVPDKTRAGLAVMNAASPLAKYTAEELKTISHAVVERVMDGESMHDIAPELGVGVKRLYLVVATHAEDAWKSSQIARALANLDSAEDALEAAKDIVQVSAARERLKSAQWQLERLHRRIFGADQPGLQQAVQINIEIKRDEPDLGNAINVTTKED